MLELRIDVDYAYPSRAKSFLYMVLSRKTKNGYLKNSRILAKMINESKLEVKAYWFFTPYTIPDNELLNLLNPEKHEVALHVVNDPNGELDRLEKATGRKISYYTIHGTARLLARVIWRRKIGQSRAQIPSDFPLKSFHDFPTTCLDVLCYAKPASQAAEEVQAKIEKGDVLEVHPEWLFQRGTINHRGPYYKVLKEILDIDRELETQVNTQKRFCQNRQRYKRI